MDQLDTARFVARRYTHLQGLRLVPLAIPFLISAGWRMGWFRWLPEMRGPWPARWFFIAFLAALLCSVAIGAYYRRRFGVALPTHRSGAGLWTLAFCAALLGSAALPLRSGLTLWLPLLVAAGGIGTVGLSEGHTRPAYLGVALACVVFSTLGPLGVSSHARDVLLDCLVAGGLLAIGLSDHRLLSAGCHEGLHDCSV